MYPNRKVKGGFILTMKFLGRSTKNGIAIVFDIVFFTLILVKIFGDDYKIVGGFLLLREIYVIMTLPEENN